MNELRDVIWIASYPKSGNTWVCSVIQNAGINYGFPESTLDYYMLSKEGKNFPICECVNPNVTIKPCSVLKTHALIGVAPPHHDNGFNMVGFIHIYRNPFDVLLSYLNFTRLEYSYRFNEKNYKDIIFYHMLGYNHYIECDTWRNIKLEDIPTANLDHALDAFSDSQLNIETLNNMSGSWFENTLSWINAANEGKGISIRYEDCLAGSEEFMKTLPYFTFNSVDLSRALDSVNKTTKERKSNLTDQASNNAIFFNKMGAYYYREFFSPAAITRFLIKNENILRQFGYGYLADNT
ncbi:sulfotransferase domain-containing protein [Nitrosomonas sp. Nm34]|uniref:sulfotransferase domain-containing protein n=1 Tax=Nitrosomonas sp. Nm34 TaxID=1881055 RepID=UPI0008E356C9|nr:sulfotransferase domain-containing protein [Nitrosomonas sp. Nm34]SFI58119.1 Sulfotransferase domain-containing protein [Nitrosomonas sp. Nm34]